MKVIVDISDSLLEQLRKTVDRHGYRDVREFVSIALENQIELERAQSSPEDVPDLDAAVSTGGNRERADPFTPARQNDRLRLINRSEFDRIHTVSPPDPERLTPGPLWGQYNRIFPVKIVIRVLANYLRQRTTYSDQRTGVSPAAWIPLDEFTGTTASIARTLGLKIQQEDQLASRNRSEKLAVALPIGDDPEKSINRFRSHFIGHTEHDGGLTGATSQLRFVDISRDRPEAIGITEAGRDFAQIWNPLLDGPLTADRSLSDEEREFYLSHIRENLPDELEAMLVIMHAITDGDNRPAALDSHVTTLDPNWSDAQVSTIRSGLVGRLHELGLLTRDRIGQRGVAYSLTDAGNRFVIANDASR